VVGTCVVPLTCAWFNMGCDELKASIPLYHIMAVATVASGAFALGRAGNREGGRVRVGVGEGGASQSSELSLNLLPHQLISGAWRSCGCTNLSVAGHIVCFYFRFLLHLTFNFCASLLLFTHHPS
jgi:hypothetical protein